jgi:hypothetical protein
MMMFTSIMPIPKLRDDIEHKLPGDAPSLSNPDEESMGGHMPNPESDDNTDVAAAKVGLYNQKTERPLKLNIAKQINDAEKSRHG